MRWTYGPMPWDSDPDKRWHDGCEGEVCGLGEDMFDNTLTCTTCGETARDEPLNEFEAAIVLLKQRTNGDYEASEALKVILEATDTCPFDCDSCRQ